MSDFAGFSEAALLYAENEPIVQAMRQGFASETRAFIDAITSKTRAMLAPSVLQLKDATQYRYFWISSSDDLPKDTFPQVWCNLLLPTIVAPGNLTFTSMYPNKDRLVSEALGTEINNVLSQLGAYATARVRYGFAFTIEYVGKTPEDQVRSVAEPLAAALRVMDEYHSSQPV